MARRFLAAALLLALVAAYVAAVLWVPALLVSENELTVSQERALKARHDARMATLAALGGLAVAAGTVLTLRTVRLTRQAQVTGRFTTAMEHLAHDDPHVRVAGVYSLARIARDSSADRRAVLAILGDHLRAEHPATEESRRSPPPTRAHPEVAAVAATIRGLPRVRGAILDLSEVDLRAARLEGAQLKSVNLLQTNLAGAFLERADLRKANLIGADVRGASLQGADLRGADLTGVVGWADAHTEGTKLSGVERDTLEQRRTREIGGEAS